MQCLYHTCSSSPFNSAILKDKRDGRVDGKPRHSAITMSKTTKLQQHPASGDCDLARDSGPLGGSSSLFTVHPVFSFSTGVSSIMASSQ